MAKKQQSEVAKTLTELINSVDTLFNQTAESILKIKKSMTELQKKMPGKEVPPDDRKETD
jgi:hypothetical protein